MEIVTKGADKTQESSDARVAAELSDGQAAKNLHRKVMSQGKGIKAAKSKKTKETLATKFYLFGSIMLLTGIMIGSGLEQLTRRNQDGSQ